MYDDEAHLMPDTVSGILFAASPWIFEFAN
jgi:hypothetical protein